MNNAQQFIGIDIGGTKVWAGLVSGEVSPDETIVLHDEIRPTPDTLDEFINTLVELIESMKQKSPNIGGVGISTAGTIDSTTGSFLGSTANLNAIDGEFPIGEVLRQKTAQTRHKDFWKGY